MPGTTGPRSWLDETTATLGLQNVQPLLEDIQQRLQPAPAPLPSYASHVPSLQALLGQPEQAPQAAPAASAQQPAGWASSLPPLDQLLGSVGLGQQKAAPVADSTSLSAGGSAQPATGASAAPSAAPSSGSTGSAGVASGPAQSYDPSAGVEQWNDLIQEAAQTYGVDPPDIKGLMHIESGGNPKATSSAGAASLMQVMPFHFGAGEDPYDPRTNIMRGAKVYADALHRYGGDRDKAAAAYFGAIDANGNVTGASDGNTDGYGYVRQFQAARARYQNGPSAPASNAAATPPAAAAPAPAAAASSPPSPAAGAPADMVTVQMPNSTATMQVRRDMVGEGPGKYAPSKGWVVLDQMQKVGADVPEDSGMSAGDQKRAKLAAQGQQGDMLRQPLQADRPDATRAVERSSPVEVAPDSEQGTIPAWQSREPDAPPVDVLPAWASTADPEQGHWIGQGRGRDAGMRLWLNAYKIGGNDPVFADVTAGIANGEAGFAGVKDARGATGIFQMDPAGGQQQLDRYLKDHNLTMTRDQAARDVDIMSDFYVTKLHKAYARARAAGYTDPEDLAVQTSIYQFDPQNEPGAAHNAGIDGVPSLEQNYRDGYRQFKAGVFRMLDPRFARQGDANQSQDAMLRQPLQPTDPEASTGAYADPDAGPRESGYALPPDPAQYGSSGDAQGQQPYQPAPVADPTPTDPTVTDPNYTGGQPAPEYQYQNGGEPIGDASQSVEVPLRPAAPPTAADDPGGAVFAAQDSQSTPPAQPMAVEMANGGPPTPNGDWQETPIRPAPVAQQPPQVVQQSMVSSPAGFPGLQAVYDAGGNFLHWIQGVPGQIASAAQDAATNVVVPAAQRAAQTAWDESQQPPSGVGNTLPSLRGLQIVQDTVQAFGDEAGRRVAQELGIPDDELVNVFGHSVTKHDVAGQIGSMVLDPTNYIGGGEARAAARGLEETVQGVGSRVRGALDANAERVAADAGPVRSNAYSPTPPEGTQRMYHGTNTSFERFSPDKPDTWLTADPVDAGYYAGSGPRAARTGGVGANIRAVDVPNDLHLINDSDPRIRALRRQYLDEAKQSQGIVEAMRTSKQRTVDQLMSEGYEGFRHQAGLQDQVVLFPNALERVTNAFSGTRGGAVAAAPRVAGAAEQAATATLPTRQLAGALLGTATGGAAGNAATPDDASWEERARNITTGAGIGLGAGLTTARYGTLGAARLIDTMIQNGRLSPSVLASHPDTPERVRALFALAAHGLADDAVVEVPGMAGALARLQPQVRAQVSALLDGPVTAGQVREIVGSQTTAEKLGSAVSELVTDAVTGLRNRGARARETAADAATVRPPVWNVAPRPQRGEMASVTNGGPGMGTAVRMDDPAITDMVHGIADALGIERPTVYVTTSRDARNAAAGPARGGHGPDLVLGRGLFVGPNALTEAEARALITHELAHTTGQEAGQSLLGRIGDRLRGALPSDRGRKPSEQEMRSEFGQKYPDIRGRIDDAREQTLGTPSAEMLRDSRFPRDAVHPDIREAGIGPEIAPQVDVSGRRNALGDVPPSEVNQGQLPGTEDIPARRPVHMPESVGDAEALGEMRSSGTALPGMEGLASDRFASVRGKVPGATSAQARKAQAEMQGTNSLALPTLQQDRSVAQRVSEAVSPWANRVNIVRYAGMLSDTATHAMNVMGNAVMQGVDVLGTPIAAGIDATRSRITGGPREVFFTELPARLAGMRAGASAGLQAAADVLRNGGQAGTEIVNGRVVAARSVPADATKLDEATRGFNSGNKAVDFAFEAPLRLLAASDAVFRTMAQGGHLAAEATAAAMKANGGKAVTPEMVREAMKNPRLLDRVNYLTSRSVLQEDRMLTKWYRDAITYRPKSATERAALAPIQAAISAEIPFVKTPYNVVAQGMGMTPAGLAGLIQDMAEHKAPREMEQRVARVAIGTAVMAAATADYAAGNLTGPRPTDPKEVSTLPPGWQPWSRKFQVGGETYYVPLGLAGPLALPPVMAILAGESAKKGKEALSPEWAGTVALGVGQYAAQNTFFQGVTNMGRMFDARQDVGKNLEQNAEQIAAQYSPHIIGGGALGREIQRVMGMPLRDPQGAMDALLATHPATADRVPARQDVLGRPLVNAPSGLATTLIRATRENDASVIRAFRQAKTTLPMGPPKQLKDPTSDAQKTLTPAQQKRWQRVFGSALREGYTGYGNPQDVDSLKKIEAEARTAANETVLGMR